MIYPGKLALENFKPESWELKPFDLTKINNIVTIHPFQFIMSSLYKYCDDFDDEGKLIDFNDEGELVGGWEYFDFLDNYYRYGFGSDLFYKLQDENKLYIKCCRDNKDKYYIVDKNFCLLNKNHDYLKILLFNDVKVLKLEDIDEGKKELTEIEKWKRKVVCRQKSFKNKLTLLNPEVYNNFLLFYKLSKKDKMNHGMIDYYLSFDGIEVLLDKKYENKYKNNYKDIKICEDHLFEKHKELLE